MLAVVTLAIVGRTAVIAGTTFPRPNVYFGTRTQDTDPIIVSYWFSMLHCWGFSADV